jgi:hypothetical protein
LAAENINVNVSNNGTNTIYVAFTDYSTQLPGPITWTNCTVVNNQVIIPGASAGPITTCNALVPATAGITRFCAFTSQVAVGQSPNCNLAQAHNQTNIETNFGTGSNGVCYPTSLSSCVWYDISVIPQNCTPAAWSLNYCQNTGGALEQRPIDLHVSGATEQHALWQRELPEQLRYSHGNVHRQLHDVRQCLFLADPFAATELRSSARTGLEHNLFGRTLNRRRRPRRCDDAAGVGGAA